MRDPNESDTCFLFGDSTFLYQGLALHGRLIL